MSEMPSGIIPVLDLTTRDVLYGARTTSHRYELLRHDPVTGVDSLLGSLDGVVPGGTLSWSSTARVKKFGNLTIHDLQQAKPGMLRLADVDIVPTRIRPVLVIDGLPEFPLGMYVITAGPESWSGTGRAFEIVMHDKSSVLDQDAVEASFTAPADVPVLAVVKQLVESAGEVITVDGANTLSLRSEKAWPAGTSKLTIVNELLKAIDYQALWVDGTGAFQTTPVTRPAQRSIRYTVLNDEAGQRMMRELVDGDQSIYLPEWTRDRDVYRVPNKVVAVAAGDGESEPLSGVAVNEDPTSEFSFQARGRWITRTLENVEVPDFSGEPDPVAATVAFLDGVALNSLIAATAVSAGVSLKTLPFPVELLDAFRFAHAPAGIDARHTVQSVEWLLAFDGLMEVGALEVIDL